MRRLICLGALVSAACFAQGSDFLSAGAKFQGSEPDADFAMGQEKGVLDGVPFTIYRDGSGDTAGWQRTCQQDKMSDARSCFLNKGDLFIWIDNTGVRYVHVGYEHFPRSTVAIRVDQSKPRVATSDGWSGPAAKSLVKHLLSGESFQTRFMKWPYQSYVESEEKVEGLKQGLDIAGWSIKQRH